MQKSKRGAKRRGEHDHAKPENPLRREERIINKKRKLRKAGARNGEEWIIILGNGLFWGVDYSLGNGLHTVPGAPEIRTRVRLRKTAKQPIFPGQNVLLPEFRKNTRAGP
eukprot:1195208-Prorocentrum_minimum.AAC.4